MNAWMRADWRLLLLAGLGVVAAGQEQVPWTTVEKPNTFDTGIGLISLARQFDGDCSQAGALLVGPPVTLEKALHEIPAGTRVIPIALSYTHTVGGKYLGTASWLTFRPADSSEEFEYSRTYHEQGITGEIGIHLKDDLTWGDVDEESDIEVDSAMSFR